MAQGRFSPVVEVGDAVITRYQIEQRTMFLTLLGARDDIAGLAKEQLINEAVQMNEARATDRLPTPEAIEAGLAEFASRANLTTEEFIAALGNAGVDAATFRDFVTAGLAWRTIAQTSFANPARGSITPRQIGRTLALTGTEGGMRVLVSEILLPATSPETTQASRARAAELSALSGEEAFSAAARQFSVAPSAANGGEQNWVAIEGLPDEIRGIIASLSPGQVSRPVELGNSIGIFMLRDVERVAAGTPETLGVDYALFIVGPERAQAEAVAARIDVCDDLYGEALGLSEDRLIRETLAVGDVPADVRSAIVNLDVGETSTALRRGGNATVLMVCDRKPSLQSTVDFDIVGNRLLNSRMEAMAADHLSNLRASTVINDLTN